MWDPSKVINLPEWSDNLRHLYWVLRVDARMQARRRRYYRKVEVEKLRLAEMGINQLHIVAVCRYLSNFKNYEKLSAILAENDRQLVFNFLRN